MVLATPPVPVCSNVILNASGVVCRSAAVDEPFSCSAGQIVTLTVSNKLVCVALHPGKPSARVATRRRAGRA